MGGIGSESKGRDAELEEDWEIGRDKRVLVPRFTPRKSHTGLGRAACTAFHI